MRNGMPNLIVSKRKAMRKSLYSLAVLFTIFICSSCHRAMLSPPVCCGLFSPAPDSIIGKWDWVSVGEGNLIKYNTSSGIKRSLTFTVGKPLSITHNDSSGGNLLWPTPPGLLGKTVTDSAFFYFSTQTAYCVNLMYPAVTIDSLSYQYFISHDTLQFSTLPCLAPLVSTYVRSK